MGPWSDILLQDSSGSVAVWQMNGSTLTAGTLVASPSSDWQVTDVGDYTHDGLSDILFQHTDGTVGIWEMDGGTLTTAMVVASPGPSWQVATQFDLA